LAVAGHEHKELVYVQSTAKRCLPRGAVPVNRDFEEVILWRFVTFPIPMRFRVMAATAHASPKSLPARYCIQSSVLSFVQSGKANAIASNDRAMRAQIVTSPAFAGFCGWARRLPGFTTDVANSILAPS